MQTATSLALFVFLLLPAGITAAPPAAATAANEIFYADPTIYGENGKYYLTGTRNVEPAGFAILESDNLRDWQAPSTPTPALTTVSPRRTRIVPLVLTWNGSRGCYDITVDAASVIKPVAFAGAGAR
ncbi:MAG: hypothetical protein Q7S40_26700 [Opitutaceae bacterium]|nr:hypothetical protein [Opitutaceae bacterium]